MRTRIDSRIYTRIPSNPYSNTHAKIRSNVLGHRLGYVYFDTLESTVEYVSTLETDSELIYYLDRTHVEHTCNSRVEVR